MRNDLVHRLYSIVLAFFVFLAYQTEAKAQQADAAAEVRKQCDALASHPHDPGRYAAGVADEQFAPGAAIEACELATKLNPDLAREWFQLGRAYWSGARYKEAFSALTEAASRNYAPAMKYLGDAFLSGRGLPSGQQQDGQRAMQLYKKSADGGFSDAEIALKDAEEAIKKTYFDPSIFQRPDFITMLYSLENLSPLSTDIHAFLRYLNAFAQEFSGEHGKIIFMPEGQYCKPLFTGDVVSKLSLYRKVATGPGQVKDFSIWARDNSQGENDAVSLFNRYGCKSEVTRTISNQINAILDKVPSLLENPWTKGPGILASSPCVPLIWRLNPTCAELTDWMGGNFRRAAQQVRLSLHPNPTPAPKEQSAPGAQTPTAGAELRGPTQMVVNLRVISEFPNGKISLRGGPGVTHQKLDEIPAGSILRQLAPCVPTDDGRTRYPWCKVQWNGATGWVSASGVQEIEADKASSAVLAPSFDCQRSTGEDERAICSNAVLSKLDNEVAQRYAAKLKSADADDQRAIRTEQRAWLSQRRACASDIGCLRSRFDERLQQLEE